MTPSVLDKIVSKDLIQQVVAEAVAKAFATAQQKPSDIASSVTLNQSSKLMAENIGYFDPTSSLTPATESHGV